MSSSTKVLVTGATGFIAAHVVREALEAGYSVRGTVRSPSKAKALEKVFSSYGKKFETVIIDDLVHGDLTPALEGIGAILHVASPVLFEYKDIKTDLLDPAIDGTLNVLRAATKAGINRVVITSSIAAVINQPEVFRTSYKYTPDDWNPATYEEALHGEMPGLIRYSASKKLSEEAAWNYVKEHPEIKLTTIQPTMVYGPPIQPVSSMSSLNETVMNIYRLFDGSTSQLPEEPVPMYCDVRDVGRAHVVALQKDSSIGKRVFIGEEKWSYFQAVKIILRTHPELKDRLVKLPEVDPSAGKVVCGYDTSVLEKELGIKPRKFEDMLPEMVDRLLELERESNEAHKL